jgi:hypothetical protein
MKQKDTIKIPKLFYLDHVNRGFNGPKIVKENNVNLFIDSSDIDSIDELRKRAERYAELYRNGYCYELARLAVSANHTLQALGHADSEIKKSEEFIFSEYRNGGY